MHLRTHRGVSLALLPVLLTACAAAQGTQGAGRNAPKVTARTAKQTQKANKPPFKDQIDGLIGALHQTMVKAGDGKGAMGDGSCLMTAQILAAMGLSHRGYHSGDGPIIRLPVNYLFSCRRSDGSFGDSGANIVVTTQWVLDALAALDPEQHKEDIAQGTRWLKQQGHTASAFARFVGATSPDQLKATVIAASRGLVRGKDGKPDLRASVDALLTLVKVQVQQRPVALGAQDFNKTQA
ncbi:MAG: hypothetical protein V3U11_14380, partial [Planctomycetota bacterium]